jgi:uncharacterized protein YcbX
MTLRDIGTVKAINRFPVKSFGGESLQSAELKWSGIDGDRQYAFHKTADGSRFPWLTGRAVSPVVTIAALSRQPRHSDPRWRGGTRDVLGRRHAGLRRRP